MTGVESQGVEFILRFRDEATSQISTAEGAYNSLVSAMNKVLQTEKAFAEAATDAITRTAAAMKRAGGSSLITPLTIDPSRMQLISQFEQISMQWFRDIGNMYGRYLAQVRGAITTTGTMRDILVGLAEAAKEGSGGIDSFFKAARKFTSMKFDKEGSFGQLLSNLQDIVKVFLEFFETSGKAAAGADKIADSTEGVGKAARKAKPALVELLEALRRAFTGREATAANQGAAQLAGTVEDLSRNAQQANFHMLDVRDGIRKAGAEAKDKGGMFDALKGKLGDLKKSFGDIATIGQIAFGALVGGKAAQVYMSLEDYAWRMKQQTGEMTVGTRELTLQIGRMALEAKTSQGIMGAIWSETARLSGGIYKVSDSLKKHLAQTAEMFKESPELIAQVAMKLKEVGQLSDAETIQMMSRIEQFSKGSKLAFGEWAQMTADMTDQFRIMAQSYGMSEKQVMQNVMPSVAAINRAMQDVYGSSEGAMKAIRATISFVGDEFQEVNTLLAGTGATVDSLRQSLMAGDATGFMRQLREAVQSWETMGPAGASLMQNFSQHIGMSVEEMKALGKTTDEQMAVILRSIGSADSAVQEHNKRWEEFNKTFSQRLAKFQSVLEFYAMTLFPIIDKWILTPLEKVSDVIRWIAEKDLQLFGVKMNDVVATALGIGAAYLAWVQFGRIIGGLGKLFGLAGTAAKEAALIVTVNGQRALVTTEAHAAAETVLASRLAATAAAARLTTGSILGLSAANEAAAASAATAGLASTGAAARMGALGTAAGAAAGRGMLAAAGSFLARLNPYLLAALTGWTVGDLIAGWFPKFNEALTQIALRISPDWVIKLFKWEGFENQFSEYCKALDEIQKQYGDKAAEHFRLLMKENQGFDKMSIDQFREFMRKKREEAAGAVGAQTPEVPHASNAVPAASNAEPVASSVSQYSASEPVMVDPVTGKTTAPQDDEALKDIKANYGFDTSASRPTQTTRDDVRDEKAGPKGEEMAELLRENNAHLRWIREYAASILAKQDRVMNPRNTLFTQGV